MSLILNDKELQKYLSYPLFCLQDKISALKNHQTKTWTLLKNNIKELNKINRKNIIIEKIAITIQNNIQRKKSSFADVKKNINKKFCFLCSQNFPNEERGIKWNDYLILFNPYPILTEHIVISHIKHIPQSFIEKLNDFIDLTKELNENFYVTYNGPECGASAPAHLHFQAVSTTDLTGINEYFKNKFKSKIINENKNYKIELSKNYISPCLIINAITKKEAVKQTYKVLQSVKKNLKIETEPKLNILSRYTNSSYYIFIFFRTKHRPETYFDNSDKSIKISPGAIDMGGVLVVPRPEDFNKLTKTKIKSIFKEISFTENEIKSFIKK